MLGRMSSAAEPAQGKQPRGTALTVGCLMTIGAGLLSIFNGARGIIFGGSDLDAWHVHIPESACGIVFILFGIIAVAGGRMALKGKHIDLAFAGAFLGMLAGGWFGFWAGLIALIAFLFSDADF